MGVCADFCDDYNYGIKQVAGNDDYDYASSRRATTTTTTTRADIFFSTRCSREKNLLIPAAAGSFSLDATSGVFWPHAGAWGAGVVHSAMRSAFVV